MLYEVITPKQIPVSGEILELDQPHIVHGHEVADARLPDGVVPAFGKHVLEHLGPAVEQHQRIGAGGDLTGKVFGSGP